MKVLFVRLYMEVLLCETSVKPRQDISRNNNNNNNDNDDDKPGHLERKLGLLVHQSMYGGPSSGMLVLPEDSLTCACRTRQRQC